jgi:hypothetical protein
VQFVIVIIYASPLATSRILVTAVLIQPELLELIWRQLGVPDRVFIEAYRGKSRRHELLPAGQPQCVKDPAGRLDTVCCGEQVGTRRSSSRQMYVWVMTSKRWPLGSLK